MNKFARKGFKVIRKMNSFEYVKDHVPNKIGVYVMNHKGKVMFVGRGCEECAGQDSSGLRKRLQELWQGKVDCKPELLLYKDILTVKFRVCQTVDEAMTLENKLINDYKTSIDGWNL